MTKDTTTKFIREPQCDVHAAPVSLENTDVCVSAGKEKPAVGGVEARYDKVQAIIAHYRHDRLYLLQALHEIQDCLGYIPDPIISLTAREFQLSKIDVAGVIGFYPWFSLRPMAKFVIRCCTGVSCAIRGGTDLRETIRKHLKIKDFETTRDGQFFLRPVSCLGACDQAPAMMINNHRFGNLDAESVKKILAEVAKNGLTALPIPEKTSGI
ncbi:MAG: NAD(P)H-dependent oxidoreductase subunit E [Candidatus Ozemobacteraceae bacterium]